MKTSYRYGSIADDFALRKSYRDLIPYSNKTLDSDNFQESKELRNHQYAVGTMFLFLGLLIFFLICRPIFTPVDIFNNVFGVKACEDTCDTNSAYFCHDTYGCLPLRDEGELCLMSTAPGLQYICEGHLECDISNARLTDGSGVCISPETEEIACDEIKCNFDFNQAYCTKRYGCTAYRGMGEQCQQSVSPEYQIRCLPGLSCGTQGLGSGVCQ